MATQILARRQRGESIAKESEEIERVNEYAYRVRSQRGRAVYTVRNSRGKWTCDCPDFAYRGAKCKHIFAVEFTVSEQLPKSRFALGLWEESR